MHHFSIEGKVFWLIEENTQLSVEDMTWIMKIWMQGSRIWTSGDETSESTVDMS